MHTLTRFLWVLISASSLVIASGAGSISPSLLEQHPAGWTDIQPGPDLKGWTRMTIPPDHPLGRAQWHTAGSEAVLRCDGDGGHEMLRFDRELGDCVFHVEFAFTPVTGTNRNYNSGVFTRNSAKGDIWYQAQLSMDGGYLFGEGPVEGHLKRFKLKPAEERMNPPGEWNTLELSARGKVLTVWLNGAVTCQYSDCGMPRGYIALEAEGYRIMFRKLKLKELGSDAR
ncbi:MAG TPA: DUF1080 domain-containing protein [Verrucomicrobiae bacterium]|nr:DUF1080 domain-containing protein [Verrucomicrobiae bacterium]